MFKKLRCLLAARRAFKSEEAFTKVVGLEPIDKAPYGQAWAPEKTYEKAATSANLTGTGVVAVGGPLAALMILARTFAPDSVPWPVSTDTVIVTAITAVISPILTFIRKWRSDKTAHGGDTTTANIGQLS